MKRFPIVRGLLVVLALSSVATSVAAPVAVNPRGARPARSTAEPSAVARAWGDLLYGIIRDEKLSPPVASRVIGYFGVAMHEAVSPGDPGGRSLAHRLNGLHWVFPGAVADGWVHWPTAANVACSRVLAGLLPNATPATLAAIAALETSRMPPTSGPGAVEKWIRDRSVVWGSWVAARVVAWSKTDGYDVVNNCPYTPPTGEGLWEPTPPAFQANPLQPCWGELRCFVLDDGEDCAPPAPPEYSTDETSEFWAAAEEVRLAVVDGTAEQKEIAVFWADGAGTGTPPGHWMSIVGQIAAQEDLSLARAAQAYAWLGIAVADSFIECWNTKYSVNLLRPVTYVRAQMDAAWTPILPTPPFPTYTSGHSTQSAAAATVLTGLLGDIAFTDHTHDSRGLPTRSFSSFEEASEEAAISRLYAGIHYRFDNENGAAAGRCVGEKVLRRVRGRL